MALLGIANAIETATLAVSAAVPGMGAEQLRDPTGNRARAWQTPFGTTGGSLTLALAAATAIRAVALARTNLTPAATIRVRVGAYDSGVIAAGVAVGIGAALHVLPAGVAGTGVIVDVADPANPDACLNVPLAFVGPCVDLRIGEGADTGPEIVNGDVTTRGGTVLTRPRFMRRGWTFPVPSLSDATEVGTLDLVNAAAAAGRNVLFVPRETHARAAAESVFGLVAPGRLGFLGSPGQRRTWQATITERL